MNSGERIEPRKTRKDTEGELGMVETGLVPRLRFPEFRGEWDGRSVGDIAVIYKGKGISKADVVEGGNHPCIRYGELYTTYGELISEVVSRTSVPVEDLFLSEPNDVIIPSSGETKVDIATASCVIHGGIALGGDLNVLRSTVQGPFLSYSLNGPQASQIAKVAQGDTVVHLYPHQIAKVSIGVPSRPEQEKIAACLSSLDDLIAAEAQTLDTLKAYKKGLIQQLIPQEGETVPRLRFPEFRGAGEWEWEWEKGTLDALFDFQDGFAFKSTDFVKSREGATQVIRITDINNRNTNEDKVYVPNAFLKSNKLNKYVVNNGDLLLSLTGAAGFNFFIWEGNPALINQRTAKVTTKTKSDRALTYLLEALVHETINSRGEGQNNNLSKEFLSGVEIQVPETPEQSRIASFLSSLDQRIAAQAQKIDALKTHKKGLMQGLFPTMEERSRGDAGFAEVGP